VAEKTGVLVAEGGWVCDCVGVCDCVAVCDLVSVSTAVGEMVRVSVFVGVFVNVPLTEGVNVLFTGEGPETLFCLGEHVEKRKKANKTNTKIAFPLKLPKLFCTKFNTISSNFEGICLIIPLLKNKVNRVDKRLTWGIICSF
jgi:hypothetical protein